VLFYTLLRAATQDRFWATPRCHLAEGRWKPLAEREAYTCRGLHALYKDGILSEEEYRREKQELLDRE
jgi:hypothetical protein